MSGVAGGNRIEKPDVQRTFEKYQREILEKIPGFVKVTLSGSVKAGTKSDYGDLDLVVHFEGEDKKKVKDEVIRIVTSKPDSIIVPFRSEKYKGKKYYNSGEIITVLYPIEGKEDKYIQVDNIIALTDEEHQFKNNFLDLPAEKQGLILGLTKVILLERDYKKVLPSLGIKGLPELKDNQELEFNLSSAKLTLRRVTLGEGYKTLKKEELWETTDWGVIKKLFDGYKIDGTFEELLEDLNRKLKNPRSKSRVRGVFNSMVSVKSGEVGTPKGANKEKALNAVNTLLELQYEDKREIALFAGGFKPPHKAHFANAEFLLKSADRLAIFVGHKVREGIKITQEQSLGIWKVYLKYLKGDVDLVKSEISPIRDIYEFIDENLNRYDRIITGAIPEEFKKFQNLVRNKDKYANVEILQLPRIDDDDAKFSATSIRNSIKFLREGSWIPQVLSEQDRKTVMNIALNNVPSEKDIQIQEAKENIESRKGLIKEGVRLFNELSDKQIKFWALYANLFDKIRKDKTGEQFKILAQRLKGEALEALEYFYYEYLGNTRPTLKGIPAVAEKLSKAKLLKRIEEKIEADLESVMDSFLARDDIFFRESKISPKVITEGHYEKALSQTEKDALELVNKDWDVFGGKECNNGFCDIFAKHLSSLLPGSEIMSTEDPRADTFRHVWVKYNDRYYDAETPKGVNSWKELPWIQDFFRKFKEYPKDVEYLKEYIRPASEEEVDAKELDMGIEVEKEHTNNIEKAKTIALQHLAEDPKYYTKLKALNLEEDTNEHSFGMPINIDTGSNSKDRSELEDIYREILRLTQDKEGIVAQFNNNSIVIQKSKNPIAGFNYNPYLASLLEYMMEQKLNIHPLPEVKIRRDIKESETVFGKTAYYNPSQREIVLYVEGRHPKDVIRSFAHEMIHHIQNLEDRLESIMTTNTNEDVNLLKIEEEAYLRGNIIFRNWEDKVKNEL